MRMGSTLNGGDVSDYETNKAIKKSQLHAANVALLRFMLQLQLAVVVALEDNNLDVTPR